MTTTEELVASEDVPLSAAQIDAINARPSARLS